MSSKRSYFDDENQNKKKKIDNHSEEFDKDVLSNEFLHDQEDNKSSTSEQFETILIKEEKVDGGNNGEESSDSDEKSCGSDDCNSIEDSLSQVQFVDKLKEWIVQSKVEHDHADKLLRLLRCMLPGLPKSTKTLFQNKSESSIKPLNVHNESRKELKRSANFVNSEKDISFIGNDNQNHQPTLNNELIGNLNSSVMKFNDIECKTAFEFSVIRRLNNLQQSIDYLNKRQDDMMNYLTDKELFNINNTVNCFQKYGFTLPLVDFESFVQFDKKLKNEILFKTDVYARLKKKVDITHSVTKSFSSMMKEFLSRDLAVQFTAARKARIKDKVTHKFIETELWECMKNLITEERRKFNFSTKEKDLVSAISDVITSAAKW